MAYTGPSIVDYLSSTGKDSSFAARKLLAEKMGVPNYTGTSNQNTQLLTSLRNLLTKPEAPPQERPLQPTPETTSNESRLLNVPDANFNVESTTKFSPVQSQPSINTQPNIPEKPVDLFNKTLQEMLKAAQNNNNEDLITKRNAIIQARFNAGRNTTPEELRVLSPQAQASLRNLDQSGLEDQLSGVNSAIQNREVKFKTEQAARENALDFLLKQRQLEDQQREYQDKLNAPIEINGQLVQKQPDGSYKEVYSAPVETQLKNYPASVQEYEYAKENGYKGSFNDYQNEDANRKFGVITSKDKLVKINGIDYVQNEDGTYSLPNIPQTNQASELKMNALTTAQALLKKFNDGEGTSAVGKSGFLNSLGYGFIPGTPRANFVNDFNSLKSLLSLDNVKLLKGQGAVSDAERALLEKASTKLNLSQSEKDFKSTLEDLVKSLSNQTVSNNGYKQKIQDALGQGYNPQQIIDRLKKDPNLSSRISAAEKNGYKPQDIIDYVLSFNEPLSTGLNGSIKTQVTQKFPVGTTGGQCGDFAHKLVQFPSVGDGKLQKYKSVDKFGIKAQEWRQNPRVGDVIITGENPTYGHVAVVNEILPNGQLRLSESNYRGDEKVNNSRLLSINSPQIYGAIRGPLKIKV